MAEAPQTFSESWYRVANQRICLRPSVRVRRQNFRGQRWLVLENPFGNQFFRLTPAAYEFVGRLQPHRTVEEVWKECLEKFPSEAPGQEAVIQLLSQLYHANLLQYSLAEDATQLFKRHERTRQRQARARWLNIMFLRVPLLDPDRFLIRTLPLVGKLISPLGAAIWATFVVLALKVVFEQFPALQDATQGILAPANLLLLYLGLVMVKTLHEFGHAYFCRHFGGEVHVMGVMLLVFTPVPYLDATSSWGFRSRWHRILVGAAGMIVEVFVAALATLVWAYTGPGVIHSLAYNILFVASVSTLVFNLNPLLRFDGYYILSDLLEIPNLNQRSGQQLRYLAERYLFGVQKGESRARSRKEAAWLTVFGVASGIYRVIVFGSILLFVADRFLLLGVIMAVICAVSWVAVPSAKFIIYLASNPRLARNRMRAIGVTAGLAAGLIAPLQWIPMPHHFRAPGVLRSREWQQVFNESPGYFAKLLHRPGAAVRQGEPVLQLENPELDLDIAAAQAGLKETEARLLWARQQDLPSIQPLTSRLKSAQLRLALLEKDKTNLTVRASKTGLWLLPHPEDLEGRWLTRGLEMGLIIDPSDFQFVAIVQQEDSDRIFARNIAGAEIRIHGQSGTCLTARQLRVIPAEKKELPSAALGWAGGGEVRINVKDPEGREAAEPFFEVHADVDPQAPATLLHGRAGQIRFELEPEPLLARGFRRLHQLLQKRYQL